LAALTTTGAIHSLLGPVAGYILVLGLILFCGDLSRRAFSGVALFPRAAPTGGFLLMIGWIIVGIAALVPTRS
ncbi:DUF423 domain-containing protein, partial [Streptomyces griseus]|nr:DUF423 domain-containing protein [Streptomyces griseus]